MRVEGKAIKEQEETKKGLLLHQSINIHLQRWQIALALASPSEVPNAIEK